MDKGSSRRAGRIVTGGHTTRVEGLNKFLDMLLTWPEIDKIHIGGITYGNRVGRKTKKLKIDPASKALRAAQGHKRPKRGGGFSFKATRLALIGNRVTGINCYARYGSYVQLVVLTGDIDAIKARLNAEGYGAKW